MLLIQSGTFFEKTAEFFRGLLEAVAITKSAFNSVQDKRSKTPGAERGEQQVEAKKIKNYPNKSMNS